MKHYLKHIKPYWIFFVLSPLLMIIEVYCDVLIPSLAAEVITLVSGEAQTSEVVFLALRMLGYVAFAIAGGIGASYCATRASVNFSTDVREELFAKIQTFSFANIDKFSTGSLITRLTNDITQIQSFVVLCLRMVFRAPGMLIGAMIMAYLISPSLSIIFILLLPVLTLIIYITVSLSYKKFDIFQTKIDALNTNVQEVLTNVRVIKALTREKHEHNKFCDTNDELKESGLKAYRITILQTPLMTLFINAGTIAILWFGNQVWTAGDIAIGDISALVTYLAQVLMSVNMLAMVFLQSSRAIVSCKRVSQVLDADVDILDGTGDQLDKTVDSGAITFEHVNFRYYKNSEEKVLSDISIHIPSGQTVGIIGSTGCGKTSFVNLIARLYDVDSGAVLVDGVNVKDYSLKNLRDGVSMVLQNNILFSGSIAENLRWGDQQATDSELQTVSDWSAASEFIEGKRDGFQSMLDQGGLNLSGGQKQRLCIARALLKKPKILILDDSTSAVDTATERTITSHLKNELADTTKIIIAQRITSVMNADMILVMNEGRIEHIGDHTQLLENCLTYQEIYHSQMEQEVTA